MARKKRKECPKEFEEINQLVGRYTGLYANWRLKDFEGGTAPELLLEIMNSLNTELKLYLETKKEN